MDRTYFVTITGINHYYGKKPFEIGRVFKLIKEPDNDHDKEAIAAFLPFIEKIGYVANSTGTVYQGTTSAGRLYDKIEDHAYAKVMFVTHSSVIALVIDKEDIEETGKDESGKDVNGTDDREVIIIEEGPKKKTKGKNPIGFGV